MMWYIVDTAADSGLACGCFVMCKAGYYRFKSSVHDVEARILIKMLA